MFRSHRIATFVLFVTALVATLAPAQVSTFAGNAQHTQQFATPAQYLNRIKWSMDIDLNNSGAFAHYGSPLITAANNLMVPVKTASNGFQVDAVAGATGAPMYTLASDYILPSAGWIPVYQPVLAAGPSSSTRLYYPGAGGTVWYIDNPDSAIPATPTRLVFYTTEADYNLNAAGFNSTIFINTPITADSNGTIFFGFRTQGTAPAPLSTTESGFARIDSAGNATYVLCSTAAADATITRDTHNSAPALSADEQVLYVPVKSTSSSVVAYLLALNANDLTTINKVFLKDPRNGSGANLSDFSTASPMVAPDGDVYFGVLSNPYNGSRGWLLRFTADLTVEKTPGGFGWDYTPAIVPASMVPSYTGGSSYLLFCKYNNYPINDGDGTNKVAILDPNATQIDPHPSAPGLVEMREVLVMFSPTRDNQYPSVPIAVREWCINASAVNVATGSVYFDCEDGRLYRWHLATNSLSAGVSLNAGIGQPYVPTVIGPDGTVYTLNGGILFAIGGLDGGLTLELDSSHPDVRTAVIGDNITFTASASGTSGTPTGNVTFEALTHNGVTPETTTLGTVPLDPSGNAVLNTSAFLAGGAYLGNYHITATYSGDLTYGPGSASRYQKVHASATTTTVTPSSSTATFGSDVTFTATVASDPGGGGIPTGFITFRSGTTILSQVPLDGSGMATYVLTAPTVGAHTVSADYNSDTYFASSSGDGNVTVEAATTTTLASPGPNPSNYGDSLTFTATVAAVDGGAGTPAGSVTFTDGVTVLAVVPVDGSGEAEYVTSTLALGSHSIGASFTGSTGWLGSSGTSISQTVQGPTTTTLGSSLNPSVIDQTLTFTATVAAVNGGAGTPTGTVDFTEGATTLASVAVNGSGQASFNISTLSIGGHTIVATFTPTGSWLGSNDDIVQTVTADTTPPTMPTGLTATSGPTRGQLTLNWTASTDPDDPVASYQIWRSKKLNTGYSLIATVPGTSYVDNPGRNQVRYYYVRAVDSHGNISAASAKVTGTGANRRAGP